MKKSILFLIAATAMSNADAAKLCRVGGDFSFSMTNTGGNLTWSGNNGVITISGIFECSTRSGGDVFPSAPPLGSSDGKTCFCKRTLPMTSNWIALHDYVDLDDCLGTLYPNEKCAYQCWMQYTQRSFD